MVYFAYHAIQGDRGFIALGKLEHQVSTLDNKLADLQKERLKLENQVSLLRPDSLDPDMLEERARIV
ncbi:MAG: septum formation initiator family protein, partial [Rhodospirillaceae bacterium]|nr:septum formation initiator family protein [Rhodospirillaceae bacterium]